MKHPVEEASVYSMYDISIEVRDIARQRLGNALLKKRRYNGRRGIARVVRAGPGPSQIILHSLAEAASAACRWARRFALHTGP